LEAIRAPKITCTKFLDGKIPIFSTKCRAKQSKAKTNQINQPTNQTSATKTTASAATKKKKTFAERGMAKVMSSDLSLEGARE
jgi:hypothetical protein